MVAVIIISTLHLVQNWTGTYTGGYELNQSWLTELELVKGDAFVLCQVSF